MDRQQNNHLFDISEQVVVVTGGAGVICSPICQALAAFGARIAILDINLQAAQALVDRIGQNGGEALAIACDVSKKADIEAAAQKIVSAFGRVDTLFNAAGGNKPQATTGADSAFFDLPEEALRWVIDLNLISMILCSQVFGKIMANQKKGIILNMSSMNTYRPLTRVPAYSAAKAAVSNFTQWLAVHMAQEYSPEIRVNAIAPGFFLTEQNRYLVLDKDTRDFTPRGQTIVNHTPMRRFGDPEDLIGTVCWLISPASSFITGIVVPIDGGFSAYSGV